MKKQASNALSASNFICRIHGVFSKITDRTTTFKSTIALVDYLMSGVALFKLKFSTLLQFDKPHLDPMLSHIFNSLFHIDQILVTTLLDNYGLSRALSHSIQAGADSPRMAEVRLILLHRESA